jgi:hypothetical protein
VNGMKQSKLLRTEELFRGSGIVRKHTFKTANTRDKSAFLAVVCPVQAAMMGLTRGKSAHFQVKDCFECQSPQKSAA